MPALPASDANPCLAREEQRRYLHRIGLLSAHEEGQLPAPDLETLQLLHKLHPVNVRFENLSLHVPDWRSTDMCPSGAGPKLDLPSLYDKIVIRGRGGYCFELNSLAAGLLRGLGYTVRVGTARVVVGGLQVSPAAEPHHRYMMAPHDHQLLFVSGGALPAGREYLVDVGFGGNTLTQPIPLPTAEELEQLRRNTRWDGPANTDVFQYRLRWGVCGRTVHPSPHDAPHDQGFCLQIWANRPDGPGAWHDLYWFTLQTYTALDITANNYFISTFPQSAFVKGVLCTAVADGYERLLLTGNTFVRRRISGHKEVVQLNTQEEIAEALRKHFNIQLPAGTTITTDPFPV